MKLYRPVGIPATADPLAGALELLEVEPAGASYPGCAILRVSGTGRVALLAGEMRALAQALELMATACDPDTRVADQAALDRAARLAASEADQ